MSIKNIFNPDCNVDILASTRDSSYALIDQKVGRVTVEFAATVKLKSIAIDFPNYLKQRLESYQMGITSKGAPFLLMTFKSARQDLFIRSFKKALAEEMRDSLNIETILPDRNERQHVWAVESITHLNDLLDHLARPGTQNRILTLANATLAPHQTTAPDTK